MCVLLESPGSASFSMLHSSLCSGLSPQPSLTAAQGELSSDDKRCLAMCGYMVSSTASPG